MADQKISQLSSGAPAQAGDEYVVARSGANYKLTLTNIAANMPATTVASGDLIVSSGNVGIGTASPASRLDVVGSAAGAVQQFLKNSNGSTNSSAEMVFGTWSGSTPSAPQAKIAAINMASSDARSDLAFSTYTGAALTERMRIDSSGNVGIGGTAAAYDKLLIGGTLPTNAGFSLAYSLRATIPSGTTSTFIGFDSAPITQAASFTLTNLYHFLAEPQPFGAGSAVTNQYGYAVSSGLTGATNNFGFYSNIASGSNRWNFYAAGTARNYFAGRTDVGNTRIAETNGWNGVLIDTTNEITIADGGTITLCNTICASMMIHVYQTNNGNGGVFFATYATAVTKVAGDGEATDTGSLFAVYKSTNSHTVTLKNRSGASRNYKISIFASAAS